MTKTVFVIDDDDFSAIHLDTIIGDSYEVVHHPDPAEGVAAAAANPPALVLMDVNMPDINGYEACRRLKAEPRTADIPVIFVSACGDVDDRLAGYEAGGDDYVTKPFVPDELRAKIAVVLRKRGQKRDLTRQAKDATVVAMTALSAVGDAGTILRFLREMVGCLDFAALNEAIFRAMDEFGLDVSVQLRDQGSALSRCREGVCSPLEESVLSNMALCARIVDLAGRSAFNHERVSIIVKNMPRSDSELYGRIKDSMATMAEAIDVHLQSMALVGEALERGDTLLQILQRNTSALREIETRYREQRLTSSQILEDLANDIEDAFVHLGLTDKQEHFLQDRVRDAINQAQALYDQSIEVEAIMQRINLDMGSVLKQEVDGIVEASAGATRVELF